MPQGLGVVEEPLARASLGTAGAGTGRSIGGRVAFAVGTGRCGTKFLYQVLKMEPDVAAHHERQPLGDAFHRYCQWYRLPIDQSGFYDYKDSGIRSDLVKHKLSFEASAYLSLSVLELHRRYDARFVLLVRRPDRVVTSYLQKGWYGTPLLRADPRLAPGYQLDPEGLLPNAPFSRIVPFGDDDALQWHRYTIVGKIAWYWSTLNAAVVAQFQQLPAEAWQIVRLEDMSFERYREVGRFFGIEMLVDEARYRRLAESRPNTLNPTRSVFDWNPQECREFERMVRVQAESFGYPWKTDVLRQESEDREVKRSNMAAGAARRLKSTLRRYVLKCLGYAP